MADLKYAARSHRLSSGRLAQSLSKHTIFCDTLRTLHLYDVPWAFFLWEGTPRCPPSTLKQHAKATGASIPFNNFSQYYSAGPLGTDARCMQTLLMYNFWRDVWEQETERGDIQHKITVKYYNICKYRQRFKFTCTYWLLNLEFLLQVITNNQIHFWDIKSLSKDWGIIINITSYLLKKITDFSTLILLFSTNACNALKFIKTSSTEI